MTYGHAPDHDLTVIQECTSSIRICYQYTYTNIHFYITNLTGIHVNVTTQTTIEGEKKRESVN